MKLKHVISTKTNTAEAVKEIKNSLEGLDIKMLLFFGSSAHNPQEISKGMKEAFPNAKVVGASTSGEIISGQMTKESVVAMALTGEVLENVAIEIVKNIKGEADIKGAFDGFEKHFGEPVMDMSHEKYIGMILLDGLSLAEEKIIEKIGDLTNVAFVGGSAGDDLKFEGTHLYVDGEVYDNAAVLMLMKPSTEFDIIKTQSATSLNKILTATKVDEANRTVIEFNGKPALEAYAEAIGVSKEDAPNHFMKHPLGVVAGDETFIRSPQKADGDNIVFFCQILDGMEVHVLETGDIVGDTKKAVEDKAKELGGISGIINYHCILRTLDLESQGLTKEYGEVFSEIPTIGFSTYGEAYLGHINQTSTMVVFK